MSEVSETSEKILQYEPTAMVLHQPIPRPSQSFNFVTKVSISSPRLYFTMNQIMPESSDLKIEQFRGLSACPHMKNTWIMRMSFTAFWKTNNHSSSCTQQTEHHIIYLYNICIVKIQVQNIDPSRWFIYMHEFRNTRTLIVYAVTSSRQ